MQTTPQTQELKNEPHSIHDWLCRRYCIKKGADIRAFAPTKQAGALAYAYTSQLSNPIGNWSACTAIEFAGQEGQDANAYCCQSAIASKNAVVVKAKEAYFTSIQPAVDSRKLCVNAGANDCLCKFEKETAPSIQAKEVEIKSAEADAQDWAETKECECGDTELFKTQCEIAVDAVIKRFNDTCGDPTTQCSQQAGRNGCIAALNTTVGALPQLAEVCAATTSSLSLRKLPFVVELVKVALGAIECGAAAGERNAMETLPYLAYVPMLRLRLRLPTRAFKYPSLYCPSYLPRALFLLPACVFLPRGFLLRRCVCVCVFVWQACAGRDIVKDAIGWHLLRCLPRARWCWW